MIRTKPMLMTRANTFDEVMRQMYPSDYAMDDHNIYLPGVDTLPSVMDLMQKQINPTQSYENITSSVAGKPASGKGKKKVAAVPPKYENVADLNSQGSFANPIIERRMDPVTGIESDHRIIQRSDGEWIALTPQEYQKLADNYTAEGHNPMEARTLPPQRDVFAPTPTAAPSATGTGSTANTPPATATQPTAPSVIGNAAQQIEEVVAALKKSGASGGTVRVPDDAANQRNMAVWQANEDAKTARYQEIQKRIADYNAESDYFNAGKRGYVQGHPDETSAEFKRKYGDEPRRGGTISLEVPKMQDPGRAPVAPLPPDEYVPVSINLREAHPRGSGPDPRLRLRIQQLNPADTQTLAASNYLDNTMYNVKSQWGTAIVNPQNVYSMLSSAAGYNYGNGMGALTADRSPRQVFKPNADGSTTELVRDITAAEQAGWMMMYFAIKNNLVAPRGTTPSSRHLFYDNGNGYQINDRAFSQLVFDPETGKVTSTDNPEAANVFNQVLTNSLDVLSGRPTNTGQSTWQLDADKQIRPAVSAFKPQYRNFDENELVDTHYAQALSWILAKMQTDRMPISFR